MGLFDDIKKGIDAAAEKVGEAVSGTDHSADAATTDAAVQARAGERDSAEAPAAPAAAEPAAAAPAKKAAPAAPHAPAPTAHKQRTYTVRAGDTLSEIGAKFGVDYHEIAKLNHVKNPDLIYPGQVFTIPS